MFCPVLKGILLLLNIWHHVSVMERDGVVPSKMVQVLCTVNKKGIEKGMKIFYYCTSPVQLLANMIKRMFLDNTFQDSQDFSLLINLIIIYIGFDKSDSDFVGTWCPCNCKNGNSVLFMQTCACLEGPVSEDYANELITINKREYPIQPTIQSLVDNSLYTFVISEKTVDKLMCKHVLHLCLCLLLKQHTAQSLQQVYHCK